MPFDDDAAAYSLQVRQRLKRAHPLVQLLFKTMWENGVTVTQLSKRSGISRDSIYDWTARNNPSLTGIIACLNALDFDLVAVQRSAK